MSGTNNNQTTTDDTAQGIGIILPNDQAQAISILTNTCLEQLDPDDYVAPEQIADQVVQMVRDAFVMRNENAEKGTKWKIPSRLAPQQIAAIMLHVHIIKSINCGGVNSDPEYDILGIYQESGKDAGIYVSEERKLWRIIHRYNNALDTRGLKEVMARLQEDAERVTRCDNRDLIAVNNGIFNYKTKTLEPFSPDLVFTAKCHVDYNPVATSPVIHNDKDGTDWEIEDWIKDLFNDGSDIPETIWQIMGAIIRPNVRWGKSAWFVSEKGNNGKGTLCRLMRNLAGEGSCQSIPLDAFSKDFMLEPLIGATSIITDENDVGAYIDKAANLKAIITNDVIQINRKFKTPISYQFKGFMVQCINGMPRIKDKSESFYRRQLFIPFDKCYTGMERKYIKDDYLNRQDVLEYALYRILNMDYYEITEPESCKAALEGYKTFNDPVRDFIQDVLPRANWGCIPAQLAFEIYKKWGKINNSNGSIQGRNTFLNDVKNLIDPAKDGWFYAKTQQRVLTRMDGDEPLLDEYDCRSEMAKMYKKKPEFATGLFKCDVNITGTQATDDNTDAITGTEEE